MVLSDVAGDCEVIALIGGIKVCLMIGMNINCVGEVKQGWCLSDRPLEMTTDLFCSQGSESTQTYTDTLCAALGK